MKGQRLASVLTLAAGLAVFATAGPIYIEDNSGNLGTITTGGVYSQIGVTLNVNGAPLVLGDLAIAPNGALYGTNYDGSTTNLYSINKSTAAVTFIGSTGAAASTVAGGVIRSDGVYFANNGTSLVTLNLATGAETFVGNMGVATDGDFAFDDTGTLYMTGGNGHLYTVDQSTGLVTLIGSTQAGLYGMVFEGGTLYGFGFNNHLYSLNRGTGAATDLGAFSNLPGGWGGTFGAASAAASVPALPAMIPMALGLAATALRRRRRQ